MSELWRVARVAQYLDVTKKRVYAMIREGKIEALRLSQRGTRIPRESVEEFVRRERRIARRRRENFEF